MVKKDSQIYKILYALYLKGDKMSAKELSEATGIHSKQIVNFAKYIGMKTIKIEEKGSLNYYSINKNEMKYIGRVIENAT